MRLRGLVKPPRTLVAFHPLARTDEYTGVPAPEQEEGTVTLLVILGLTLIVKVVDTLVADAPVFVELAMLEVEVAAGKRLLETQALKSGLRAAFKSWVHLPKSW